MLHGHAHRVVNSMNRVLVPLAFVLTLHAAHADNLTILATLTGKCTSVTAMDVVTDPALCVPKMTNIEYPNGRLGFIFLMSRKHDARSVVISFFGDGEKQLHLDKDTAMQPIDRVHFTFQGSTDDFIAAGSCRFSNPYKNAPAKVSCTADTNRGKFEGEFISNGVAPDMSQIR
jgi:hypothetical protein